jgi:porin
VPFTQVTEYWLKQQVGERLTFKLGKQDANRDFILPEIGAEFVNSSFSLVPTMAPPTYPNCGLGVAAFFAHDERTTVRCGVFDGAFFVGKLEGGTWGFESLGRYGALGLGEIQHRLPWHEQMPSNLRAGAWYHTHAFPVSGGSPGEMKQGNHGFYFSGEQMIWREDAEGETPQGVTVFGQYAISPYDRNVLESYLGGGALWRGLLPGRDDDAVGCGVAHCRFSRGSYAVRTAHVETAVELFYKAYITPYFRVQPELQYIASPSGYLPDALVAGVRVELAL